LYVLLIFFTDIREGLVWQVMLDFLANKDLKVLLAPLVLLAVSVKGA
jgi:hypothetical protein